MKLPNAPLIEVVFELRWTLKGGQEIPPALHVDPGFELLAENFENASRSHGFEFRKDMDPATPGPMGHSVKYRYMRSSNEPFPLWQIGPGIFACNQATEYDWDTYKELVSRGLQTLFASYPKIKSFPLKPVYLELRYIDAFNEELLGHKDLIKFLSNDTSFSAEVSDFLKSDKFVEDTNGLVRIAKSFKNDRDTIFQIEIGTGQANQKPGLVVISQVKKKSNTIDVGATAKSKIKNIMKWLDSAHEATSPFFRDFVSAELMKEFQK